MTDTPTDREEVERLKSYVAERERLSEKHGDHIHGSGIGSGRLALFISDLRDLLAAREADRARVEALEAELNLMKTAGVIEVAVRNPSVMDYMKHWEKRAETAEAKAERLRTIVDIMNCTTTLAHALDAGAVCGDHERNIEDALAAQNAALDALRDTGNRETEHKTNSIQESPHD